FGINVRCSSSFWYPVTSTVTPGWSSSNSAATSSQKPLNGSPVALCHQVMVTSPSSPAPSLAPPLQPASPPTASAAPATTAAHLMFRLIIELSSSKVSPLMSKVQLWDQRRHGSLHCQPHCRPRCDRRRCGAAGTLPSRTDRRTEGGAAHYPAPCREFRDPAATPVLTEAVSTHVDAPRIVN